MKIGTLITSSILFGTLLLSSCAKETVREQKTIIDDQSSIQERLNGISEAQYDLIIVLMEDLLKSKKSTCEEMLKISGYSLSKSQKVRDVYNKYCPKI